MHSDGWASATWAKVNWHRLEAGSRTRCSGFKSFEMWDELLGCLEDFAELIHQEGSSDRAVRIWAAAAKARVRLSLARSPRAEVRSQNQLTTYGRAITGATLGTNLMDGCEWDVEDAIVNALQATAETSTTI